MTVPAPIARLRPLAVAVLLCLAAPVTTSTAAPTVEDPRQIGTSTAQNPTLGIPRWKAWIDPSSPDHLRAVFANATSSGNNVVFTQDGGATWSTAVINPGGNGYLDYHVSLFGKGGDLFFTFREDAGIQSRRLAAPATSESHWEPPVTMPATTAFHRSNTMVDGDGRLWIFTRRGDSPAENVRYHYSDDDGVTWTHGLAVDTGSPNVRIGSMPYVDGRACLVVLHLDSDRGYEYHLWNGTGFEARSDHAIRPENVGTARSFSHNVVGGSAFHLVLAHRGELLHYWKYDQGGTGAWNSAAIDSHAIMDDMVWYPSTTVRGDDLYLFYSKWDTTAASSQIYLRRWSQAAEAWDPPLQISVGGLTHNVHPNTCFSVPATADYIPVIWTSGPAADTVQYNRLSGLSVPIEDLVPPAAVGDFKAVNEPFVPKIEITWTAPGDDGTIGTATSYDIRYAPAPVTEANWFACAPLPGEPVPQSAGGLENIILDWVKPTGLVYFGMKSMDDAGNVSPISNGTYVQIGSLSAAGDVPGAVVLDQNYPNPFNPQTVIPFALPRAGTVRLEVYDGAGRRVARLVDGWRAEGAHEARWDGRGDDGRSVASGVYYTRLVFGDEVTTRPVTLLR